MGLAQEIIDEVGWPDGSKSDAGDGEVDSLFGDGSADMDLHGTHSDLGQSDREDSLYGSPDVGLSTMDSLRTGNDAEEKDDQHSARSLHMSSSCVKQQMKPMLQSAWRHGRLVQHQEQTKQLDPQLFKILVDLLSVAGHGSPLSMAQKDYLELWVDRQKKLTELTGKFRAAGQEAYWKHLDEDQEEGQAMYAKEERQEYQARIQQEALVEGQEEEQKEERDEEQGEEEKKKQHKGKPMSVAQQFEYFLESFGPKSSCHNMPLLHRRGQVRLAALLYDTGEREAMLVAQDLLNDHQLPDLVEQPEWLMRKATALGRDIDRATHIMNGHSRESTPRNHDISPLSLAVELGNGYETMTESSHQSTPDPTRPVNDSAPRPPAAASEEGDDDAYETRAMEAC